MKMNIHNVKTPTWTQSAYGEPVPTYGEAEPVRMMIGWTTSMDQNIDNSLYREYEFVALTKALPAEGSLIDDLYVVGHVEKGRWNRVFMNYAKGKERVYEQ
jgi:hypothetical protein